jgi:hypothetical protein
MREFIRFAEPGSSDKALRRLGWEGLAKGLG